MARIVIAEHELGLLFRQGRFERLLEPGRHRIWWWAGTDLRRASLLSPRLEAPDLEFLLAHPAIADRVQVFRLKDHERGLVWKDGAFRGFLGPGLHAVWRSKPAGLTVEVVDITPLELDHPRREVLVRAEGSAAHLTLHVVPEGHRGLLLVDHQPRRLLEPGRYPFWRGLAESQVSLVDVREQTLEVQGQELMTRDKVSLRLNLSVRYRVADPERALGGQADHKAAFYRELQLALRAEVGARTLDELLEQKEQAGEAIAAKVRSQAGPLGVDTLGAGLRDVILPGEMRTILNQVIEADKRAQANMIARREETAATRSLLNTAKLLEGNPTLLRLKELEATERIAERVGSLSVSGGLDALIDSLRQAAGLTARPGPG